MKIVQFYVQRSLQSQLGGFQMMKVKMFQSLFTASTLGLLILISGCTKEEATRTIEQAETSAGEAANTISEDAGKAMEEGKKVAADLSEKAKGYLEPMKEKLGDLESLKDSPEKLKKAVSDLITSIEEKAEGIKLPESVSNSLATLKEKLVELKTYLEGEVEQAKIDERVKEIVDSVKSGLGG